MLKSHNFSLNFKNMSIRLGFLTLKARLIFTILRQIFTKVLIFYYFDLKYIFKLKLLYLSTQWVEFKINWLLII